MAKKKSIYNPRAAEQKQVQAEAEALEVLLAGFSKEAIAAVLSKRADVAELLPQKKPKQDKMKDALETSAPHPKCPACGSSAYQHYGKDRRGFPRYKCTACGRTYGLSANSLVANSDWSYNAWVNFIHRTLEKQPLAEIKQGLADDCDLYTTEATILAYRHRLFQFIALRWPMPKLNGIVKIDETFFRESQKGSRHLINVSPKYIEKREARIPEHKVPAEFGIQGPEYSCVVAGIDSVGHIAAVMTGLGRNTAQPFSEYFSEYLGDIEILCTDGFPVYSQYCEDHNIIHYVQLSKWRTAIKDEC